MQTNQSNLALPACRSADENGCAQCSTAYSCHDRRLGRPHLLWAPVALLLLLAIGLAL